MVFGLYKGCWEVSVSYVGDLEFIIRSFMSGLFLLYLLIRSCLSCFIFWRLRDAEVFRRRALLKRTLKRLFVWFHSSFQFELYFIVYLIYFLPFYFFPFTQKFWPVLQYFLFRCNVLPLKPLLLVLWGLYYSEGYYIFMKLFMGDLLRLAFY